MMTDLSQRVQIDGRKHNYPIFQWMKVCQELYSSQQQSKGRSQPNVFLSIEIIFLDEKEVCEEKQHQTDPPVDALLSSLYSAQNQEMVSGADRIF